MGSLRESPPAAIGGQAARRIVDYWDQEAFGPFVSETDKLPRNVIQVFTDGFVTTVRPSGTEPKLKFYCQLLPQEERAPAGGLTLLREVRDKADAIARLVYNELLARIDLSLGEPALLLPDIVDLNSKLKFEQQTIAQLRDSLANASFPNLDGLLAWLREETAAMTAGANPLPALKAPLSFLSKRWAGELGHSPLLTELENWANQA